MSEIEAIVRETRIVVTVSAMSPVQDEYHQKPVSPGTVTITYHHVGNGAIAVSVDVGGRQIKKNGEVGQGYAVAQFPSHHEKPAEILQLIARFHPDKER